ncbi:MULTISPECIES: CdaR family transcriptional regulator [unclassified Rhodococcus (in: high G+C Gram-positive bacteria)]|uniref:PucR family transcriptional regulator n=1 Tax=unclassified Rhodococcus (in: high G+C Gram-positive bacteria) TaxID=192944 RepID=UPI00163A4C58|nr:MULTISPECIES: helix-turn-helix domain-containing protein [unclassified Rhodococcus (in: high G+C Gram-positive bacteria)]MBC2638901.1 helix-turn-helix domain-containing protein [Rhodococcus sp. 3A]MBC2896358.1 helix-turn-helix domain-containing protein [Rhodococcus sp. 4CII]
MDVDAAPDPRVDHTPRAANLCAVLSVTAHMHDCGNRDEILALMVDALPELGPFTVEPASAVTGDLHDDGDVWRHRVLLDDSWSRPVSLTLRADYPPTPLQATLLELLIQHTGSALRATSMRGRAATQERQLLEAAEDIATITARAQRLEQEAKIHRSFGGLVAAGGDESAIAETLRQLTGLAVGIEDAFGNLRVWAGTDRPPKYRKVGGRNRVDLIRRATTEGRPLRDDNRIVQMVRPGKTLLGILYLSDPDHRATDLHTFALEYAATVLAVDMSHRRSLAETEARLSRDLGADLLAGTDDDSAYSRADALGYDLHTPQRVVVVQWSPDTPVESVADAFRRHLASSDSAALLVHGNDTRPKVLTAVVDARTDVNTLFGALEKALGPAVGVVGVGSECSSPSSLPSSHTHATRALEIRKQSLSPRGVALFDDLGVYRILDSHSSTGDVEAFVQEWLGPLLDYDREHRSTMTATLAQYLECGGKYDETAQALRIHRSTLRYRMSRIHELTGRDLRSVDTRLNLHLAARALQVLAGGDRR